MNDRLRTLEEEIYGGNRPISSPESEAGRLPSVSLGGPRSEKSGRGVVPANRSARREREKEKPTSGTSGPTSSGSSLSAALKQCLENRWRVEGDWGGSMEYSQTWKEKATPAGRLLWAHTASGRRTYGSGSTGWPTPDSQAANRGATDTDERHRPSGAYRQETLNDSALRAGWGSPRATDGTHGGPNQGDPSALPPQAQTAGWPTTRANDAEKRGEIADDPRNGLPSAAKKVGWMTPRVRGDAGGSRFEKGEIANLEDEVKLSGWVPGPTPASSPAPMEPRGVLAPEFSRWLMGYPETWDEASPGYEKWREAQAAIASGGSKDMETQLSRSSRPSL